MRRMGLIWDLRAPPDALLEDELVRTDRGAVGVRGLEGGV